MTDIRVFGETDRDYLLKVVVSRIPEIEAGDHVVVRKADTAEPGQIVVAVNPGGAYSLIRAPVEDGWTVQGRLPGADEVVS